MLLCPREFYYFFTEIFSRRDEKKIFLCPFITSKKYFSSSCLFIFYFDDVEKEESGKNLLVFLFTDTLTLTTVFLPLFFVFFIHSPPRDSRHSGAARPRRLFFCTKFFLNFLNTQKIVFFTSRLFLDDDQKISFD